MTRELFPILQFGLGVKLADLPARDVERLRMLLLVEENGGGLQLTPAGQECYLALPRNDGVFEPRTADELVCRPGSGAAQRWITEISK
jgi:hypothetical protein